MEILVLRQAQDEDFVPAGANHRPHPELVEGRGRRARRTLLPMSQPPNKNAPAFRPGRLRLCRLTLTSPGSCAACATARGA
ncbi:hypothetical protein EIB18_16145 [Caulobacter vibrioides]|nr:hypothetical protein CA608_20415 [Caulobacter vibrioides]AZH14077.1 hypothetical protein EIB18_16145 [Caulobacter vibrioides]PLR16423.1 hypothetical protein CVUC_00975 [Caulobacter vibrioides]